jgi:hypothetical protein
MDIIVAFFLLGVLAGLVRSELSIPRDVYDLLGILLMLAIGLKGGLALHGNLTAGMVPELLTVLLLGALIPLACFPVLIKLVGLDRANAGSLAAHYGSVSAGTFAVALAYVETRGLTVSPQTTLYLVLLEMPAIILGIMLYRWGATSRQSWGQLLHEAFTSRGVLLLFGGVVIGYAYGESGTEPVAPFFIDLFRGVLALFLVEMGLLTASYLHDWQRGYWRVAVFALLAPPLLSLTGLGVALLYELPAGTAVVLASLTASASYIAAPAAIRQAIPQADIGMAMLASLGVTFPFNVLVGIPVYHSLLRVITGG